MPSAVRADLLGYWPFDEQAGATTTLDASGNGNDGEVIDATFSPGFRDNALDVGDANNPGRVEIIDVEARLPFASIHGDEENPGTQSATITFWMNRQGAAAHNQWTFLFDGGSDSSDPVTGRQLSSHAPWSDGNVYFDTGGCCGAIQRISTGLPEIAISGDEWVHLAYVRDVDQTRVYLHDANGTPLDANGDPLGATTPFLQSDPGAITSPVAPIIRASIGASSGGGSSNTGLIDEFCIWDEALDEGRIGALAAGQPCLAPPPEPRGDFNLDGVLDTADFDIMRSNFNQRFSFEEAYSRGDFDQNLQVNMKDFIGFREAFLSAGATAAAVPEPGAGILLAIACGTLLAAARRRRR